MYIHAKMVTLKNRNCNMDLNKLESDCQRNITTQIMQMTLPVRRKVKRNQKLFDESESMRKVIKAPIFRKQRSHLGPIIIETDVKTISEFILGPQITVTDDCIQKLKDAYS